MPRSDAATLRTFVAVAHAGSVARAAEWLGRTQPSVSARLATLEGAWNTRLFRRRARGMLLSPEGGRLLPLAEAALRQLEDLDRAAGLPVAPAGLLRLGAGDALGRDRLPRALAGLLRRRRGLEVLLREGPAPRLLEALRDGEIDLALVVRAPDTPTTADLDGAPLLRSEVRLLEARNARTPRLRPASIRGLSGEPLVVLQAGSGFRRLLEAAFAAEGASFRPAVEVGSLSLVRRFVAAGLGVAPVPEVAFPNRASRPGVTSRRISGIPPVVYDRVVRAGVPLPEPAKALLERLSAP